MTGNNLPIEFGAHADASDANLTELWGSLVRRWKLLFGVAAAVTAVVMAITLAIPPLYESEAVLRVRSDEADSGMLDDLLPVAGLSLPGLGDTDIETEVGVLGSRRIADLVVDSTALHVDLLRPLRARRGDVIDVIEAGPDAIRGVYALKRRADGSYAVSYDGDFAPLTPDRVTPGEPFDMGNMRLALVARPESDAPGEIRIRVRPFQRVVTRLRDRMEIGRQDSRSQLIDVNYRHRDPRIAAAVVNATIEYFVDYSRSSERHESSRKAEILADQVARYEHDLALAEQRLQTFQERERLIAPEEQATLQVRRIAEVQATYDAMVVERTALATLISRIADPAAADSGEAAHTRLATFPSFISNGAVQSLLETLVTLENQRSELLARRTQENEDVRVLNGRIGDIQQQLVGVGTSYLGGLDHQIASAETTLARFGRDLEAIPAVEVELARLVRERELLSQVYLLLQGRLREATVQEAIDDATVRVVDYGIVAERAAFPRPLVSFVLASVLGLMAGLFTVVGFETVNPSVRSRRDAERAAPGVPVIGVIPPLQLGRRNGWGLAARGVALPSGNGARAAPDPLITRGDPWHPASEAYRGLAAGLFGSDASPPGMLVITSALPMQGKSLLAANLAITLARGGTRTLLMDGDLRGGDLAGWFGVAKSPGWAEAVLQDVPLAECLREVDVGGFGRAMLHLLPAGAPALHPAEVIGSPGVRTLLDTVAGEYDAVIIDTPALQSVFDAAMLAGMAGSTLLVVRSGATLRSALEHATTELGRTRARLSGVVLTDFEYAAPTSGFLSPQR